MTQEHAITPPDRLIHQWIMEATEPSYVPTQAARWGANQELEACCSEMDKWGDIHYSAGWKFSKDLRNARRPKPPSLKEQALSEVAAAVAGGNITPERGAKIRLALEQLDD